ncbi:DNA phosphorothioation system sulfurtransferase DndC [Candidatus Woesearchaeota archaeon]|nr:MAG: DNA phosphorothioation system sulfurtransferase DndC [Candidatus Woesearchaeota archaeon]
MADSIFNKKPLKEIYLEIQKLYLSDNRPWVIGFSGGKDSTTCVQLVWYALSELPEKQRTKKIYVISSNTMVESPILLKYMSGIHIKINQAAKEQNLPIIAQHVYPKVEDTFWTLLLGKGYPAPQRMFRWCTDRLKIRPADTFILDKVSEFGEVILILGVRKEESTTRAQVMSLYKIKDTILSRHSRFPQAFVYTPIENFSVDDVWTYLLQKKSPWGSNNRELLNLYTSKNAGECPLVVDKTTPSCGGSRFGCWTCTVVNKDTSMQNLIENGETWMKPLMEIRDYLFETTDPERKSQFREYKGRNGQVRFKSDGTGEISRGPYKLSFCKELFKKLLEAQKEIEKVKPGTDFKIITDEEIHHIRKLWLTERGDWEDSIPKLYRQIMDQDLDWVQDDVGVFTNGESKLLNQICTKHDIPTDLVMKLLGVEREIQGMTRRASAYVRIDKIIKEEWRSEEEMSPQNTTND